MRSLSATLLAAQRSESRRPYVRAVFGDYDGDRPRLRFSRYYTGAETEGPAAVVVAPDGAVVRARVDPGTNVLYTSRVASPGSGSTWSAWASHGAIAAAGGGVALLQSTGAELVLLFAAAGATADVHGKVSSDHGATWGAEFDLRAAGAMGASAGAVAGICGAYPGTGPGGRWRFFWSASAVVYASGWSGAAWFAGTAWSNTVASCTGLACDYQGDWVVAVCGTASGSTDAKAWCCFYGDGLNQAANTWSALVEVQTATAGSLVAYRSPAIEYSGCWRLFFDEKYTGSLAYSRLQWSTMGAAEQGNAELWREPQAFDYTGDYGLACSASGTGLWLAAAAGVWFGALPGAAYDASADVVEVDVDLEDHLGRVRLVLENASGSYSATNAAIGIGRRLALSFGFYGAAGLETSDGPGYWVESVEWRHERDGSARAVVHAVDGWGYLEGWRARRQFVWAAGARNVSQLVTYVFARAGLDYASLSASSAFSSLTPAFTVHAGESGLVAVQRLLAMVPDRIIMRSGAGRTLYPQAADASVYTYGITHVVLSARYRARAAAVNRARAFGPGLFDERFDFADIEASGERLEQVLDLNLTTTALAGSRAGYMLRQAAYGEVSDELVAPLNCGQELLDVVGVTDAGAGLVAAKRRVLSLRFRFSALVRGGRCDVELGLGAP